MPVSMIGHCSPRLPQAARWLSRSMVPSTSNDSSVAVFWNVPAMMPSLLIANCRNSVASSAFDSSCVSAKTPSGNHSTSSGSTSGTLVAIC